MPPSPSKRSSARYYFGKDVRRLTLAESALLAAFTLASVVDDQPLRVETATGVWQPNDYDGEFRGPVTLREAMERFIARQLESIRRDR